MPNTDCQSYLTTTGEKLVYFACRISKVPPKAMGIILNGHGERISGISSYHGYQQLSRVSPLITGRYTLQISRFTRQGEGKAILVLETGIIAHPRPRNRDIFTGLDISRIPHEDEIPSSPRESTSPRITSEARIDEDCPREPCLTTDCNH